MTGAKTSRRESYENCRRELRLASNLPGAPLTPADVRRLEEESWLNREVLESALLRRVDSPTGAELVGRNGAGDYSGIAIPYFLPGDDRPREYRLRLDHPPLEQSADGQLKPKQKYLAPPGRSNLGYFPRGVTPEMLADRTLPVIIVEGEKKTLALWRLAWHGLPESAERPRFLPIGISGVWNWRGVVGKTTGPNGDRRDVKGIIPDLSRLAWQDRLAIICFDSDAKTNPNVEFAKRDLAATLTTMGAVVKAASWDAERGKGVDDVLAAEGPEAVLAILNEAEDTRIIRVVSGSLADNVRDAEQYLADYTRRCPADGVYQRSGLLVEAVRLPEATISGGIRRAAGTLQIVSVNPDSLALRLAQAATWQKFAKREGAWVKADVPERVARTLCGAVSVWTNMPALSGIIEAPCLRDDGSILQTPGYDSATGLYFDPGTTIFPPIPEKPTRMQAEAALAKLLEIVNGFPFIDGASRSVAFAAMLAPLVRQALRAAPLHGVTAPKMASGKTLLAYLPGYIATGRPPALLSQAEKQEEEKKRLLAILLGGSVVTVIDNVERPLQSDALCTILTEPIWTERLLGVSRNVSVSTATVWLATGNNLQFAGDLSSRVLLCSIDPECERPEERQFAVNLHLDVPLRRGELAAAALTIIRAYLVSGDSVDVPVFGRFEDWSRLVREPLVWLGMADPGETRKAVAQKDYVRESLANLLAGWHEAFGSEPRTIGEARSAGPDSLREIMTAIAPAKDGAINTRRLGQFIAKYERRIEGGFRFERDPVLLRGVARWRVIRK